VLVIDRDPAAGAATGTAILATGGAAPFLVK